DNTQPDPRAILIVLPTWVGDFVMATPALRAIRNRFPEARITFLAEPNLRDLIEGGDWMDEVVEWPPKDRRKPWQREYRAFTRLLRARRIDWAVLLPNSARSAMLAFLARAKRRIGYNRDGRGMLLTERLPVKNKVDGKFVPLPIVEYYADLAEAIERICGFPPRIERLALGDILIGSRSTLNGRYVVSGCRERRSDRLAVFCRTIF
ncbi:MAG: glycosyltransferase family 9 protein, partial [Planctomycetes bacterium]|nr:glycosyltransferase family 9 protein [Planctomycetota bacterium]